MMSVNAVGMATTTAAWVPPPATTPRRCRRPDPATASSHAAYARAASSWGPRLPFKCQPQSPLPSPLRRFPRRCALAVAVTSSSAASPTPPPTPPPLFPPPVPAMKNVILIDMDNTLANFDAEFAKRWVAARPGDETTMITERVHFELEENFDSELAPLAVKIMSTPGFFIEFAPAPGAVTAVKEMVDAGYTVFFCTAPHPFQYETCVAEKYAWVRKHFGDDYLARIIITRDKTVVKGTVLIDDKPAVKGAEEAPEWTHVVFQASYNKEVTSKPRLTQFSDWREVIVPLLEAAQ